MQNMYAKTQVTDCAGQSDSSAQKYMVAYILAFQHDNQHGSDVRNSMTQFPISQMHHPVNHPETSGYMQQPRHDLNARMIHAEWCMKGGEAEKKVKYIYLHQGWPAAGL